MREGVPQCRPVAGTTLRRVVQGSATPKCHLGACGEIQLRAPVEHLAVEDSEKKQRE